MPNDDVSEAFDKFMDKILIDEEKNKTYDETPDDHLTRKQRTDHHANRTRFTTEKK
jgi:hypothetical protein